MNDVEDGLRTWTRDTFTKVRMRTKSVKAVQLGKPYGRYLEWFYTRGLIEGSFYNWFTERTINNQPARSWKVVLIVLITQWTGRERLADGLVLKIQINT